jgi:hypothetical protein
MEQFSCQKICQRFLKCRICRCKDFCHNPPCNPCKKKFCNLIKKIF